MRRHGGGGQEGQEGERSPARPAAGSGRGVGGPSGRAGGGAGWDRGQVGLRLAEEVPRLSGGGGPFSCSPGAGSDGQPGGPPSPRDGLGPQRKWAQ